MSEREDQANCSIHGPFYSGYVACPICLALADERPVQQAAPEPPVTPQELRDWADDVHKKHGAWPITVEKLRALADYLEHRHVK